MTLLVTLGDVARSSSANMKSTHIAANAIMKSSPEELCDDPN